MRILVVDDRRVMRQMMGRTLRQAGFVGHDIIEASNGVEGLLAVARHEPDLVLCDDTMPEMGGLEMLTALRSRGDVTPFGVVTSERSPTYRCQALAAGASFVVAKPFTAEAVRVQLQPVLG